MVTGMKELTQMQKLPSRVALRVFGLAAFAFSLIAAIGGADPWFM